MDELTEHGPVGLEMMANPFAIVPKKENADRIELAFRLLAGVKDLMNGKDDTVRGAFLRDWFVDHEAEIGKVVGEE